MNGVKYTLVKSQYQKKSDSATKRRWKCSTNYCNASIHTVNDDLSLFTSSGSHCNKSHRIWTADDLLKLDLLDKIAKKVMNDGLKPHTAYHVIARENPSAIQVMSGYKDAKGAAYKAQTKIRVSLPKTIKTIKKSLIDSKMNLNYYGQRLALKRFPDDGTSDESLKNWESRSGLMYLGDGGCGDFQVWCEKLGSQIISIAKYIHFDVSFKHTPEISPHAAIAIPYKGALHLIASFPSKDASHPPIAVPCATILLKKAKPDTNSYYAALIFLWKKCIKLFNVDIVSTSNVINGMGDYEPALKNAIKLIWKEHMIVKGCLFHYGQALNTNIGTKGLQPWHQSNKPKFDFKLYCYFRQFHSLALLPPQLVPRAWSLIVSRYKSETPSICHDNVVNWIKYHKGFWMKSGVFIKEWNCYRQPIRTNNLLECRNALINSRFGSHPFLYDFVQNLSEWFCDGFIEYEQYLKHSMVRQRHKQEILKNKVLDK